MGIADIDLNAAIAPKLQEFMDAPTSTNAASLSRIKAAMTEAIAGEIGAKNIIELELQLEIIGTKLRIGARLVADEIQIQIDQLSDQITQLQSDVTNLQGNVSGLQSDVSGLQGDITNLQAAIDGLTIGEDVQAWSDILDQFAALTLEPDQLFGTNSVGAIAQSPKKVEGYARLEHRENASSPGGNPLGAKGSWITVPLNQVSSASGYLAFVSISFGRITIPAGVYEVEGRAFGCGVVRFQSRLYNITTGQELIVGESMGSTHNTFVNDPTYSSLSLSQVSVFKDRVLIANQSEIEMQTISKDFHDFDSSLGVKIYGTGVAEIAIQPSSTEGYSSLVIQKIE